MHAILYGLVGFFAFGSTAMAAAPVIDMARVGNTLKVGQPYGSARGGFLCIPAGKMAWDAGVAARFAARGEQFQRIFRDEMATAGFQTAGRSNDLFAAEDVKPGILVGALVTELADDFCSFAIGEQGFAKGSVAMAVEWQVFSVAEDKVIARIRTTATFKPPRLLAVENWTNVTIPGAFQDNARQLGASPEFRRVIDDASVAAPSPASDTHADLVLALPPPSHSTSLKAASRSVVSIFAGGAMGSGVLISADGYLLTNHHVVGAAGRVRIRWPDGTDTVGEVIRADRRRDVALVKTSVASAQPLAIRRDPAEVGETVYAIGTPLEKEFAGTLTRGVVSAHRVTEGLNYIQSDVAVDRGNSGGPMLDEQGRIVALAVSGYERDGVGRNINFFIPVADALQALAIRHETAPEPAPVTTRTSSAAPAPRPPRPR